MLFIKKNQSFPINIFAKLFYRELLTEKYVYVRFSWYIREGWTLRCNLSLLPATQQLLRWSSFSSFFTSFISTFSLFFLFFPLLLFFLYSSSTFSLFRANIASLPLRPPYLQFLLSIYTSPPPNQTDNQGRTPCQHCHPPAIHQQ